MPLLTKRKQDQPPQDSDSDSDSEDARAFRQINAIRADDAKRFKSQAAALFEILNNEPDGTLAEVIFNMATSNLRTVKAVAGTATAVAAFTAVAGTATAGTATAGTASL